MLVCCGFINSVIATAQADEQTAYHFDIPQQALITSLHQLSSQTETLILFPYSLVEHKTGRAVKGQYPLKKALEKVLQGTGLISVSSEEGVLTISSLESYLQKSEGSGGMSVKRNLLASTIGFLMGGGVVAQDAAVDEEGTVWALEEVIVTATKRPVALQDLPMTVSVLGGETIDKRGLVDMDDYLRTLPGVSMHDRGAGFNAIVIRGVASSPQDEDYPTAGSYFGEVPISNLRGASAVGGAANADIKLVDIERIELLRGPQGTLYGAGSLSGTLRVIPASPNLEQIEGQLKAGLSQTGEAGGNNNMVQGVVNVPLIEDELAVRVVAYKFDNSGYIENKVSSQLHPSIASAVASGGVARDRGDVGADEYTGARVATLWRPNKDLDITLTYLQQEIEQDGKPEANLDLDGSYQQQRLNTGVEGSSYEFLKNDIDITSLVVNYDVGWATISSASSWLDYLVETEEDISFLRNDAFFADTSRDTSLFVEELKLVSQLQGPVQFVAGYYYEDKEDSHDDSSRVRWVWSGDPALDPHPGTFLLESWGPITTVQRSVFSEVTYSLSEKLDLTLGGRHYDYKVRNTGFFEFRGTRFTDAEVLRRDESGETYKANLSWTPDGDTLIYGQWAEGFRLGSVRSATNANARCDDDRDGILDDIGIAHPGGTESDTTENFELGLKSVMMDGRVTLSTSLYRINWEGIPVSISLPSCNSSVLLNAGESKSEGIDLEFQVSLSEQLHLNVATSYGESVLTEDAESIGEKGDNLPGSSDFNFSSGLEYSFTLRGYDAFTRVDYAYISEYYSTTEETGPASGGFGQTHLKAGISLGKVGLELFVNNVSNVDDITWFEPVAARNGRDFQRVYRVRPRTVGLNITYNF